MFKTIANSLEQKNHKVWVITNDVRGEKYQESDNLRIIRVEPTLRYRGGLPPNFLDNIRYVFNAYKKGREIVKKEKIDLVHSNNFSPALAGSLISMFAKVPHITTIHDVFSVFDKKFWKKWASQSGVSYTNARLVPLFERIMMKFRFDCIHTVSDATKKDIQSLGTNKPIYVIPNCLQDEQPYVAEKKDMQFLYLGRLVFYKNVEVVLQALKIVSEEFPDVKLLVAGDGPHKESLQKLSTDMKLCNNVTFLGYVTPEEKKRLLASSKALLFPSIIEGFGLVILESFQQKRPVIVSDVPPMSDIVENKKTGLVVDPHDKKKWVDAVVWMINNPQALDKMGEEGNHVLKTKYSQELFYDNIMKMYNDVLK